MTHVMHSDCDHHGSDRLNARLLDSRDRGMTPGDVITRSSVGTYFPKWLRATCTFLGYFIQTGSRC
jgi:hypothetical protein